MTLKLWLRERGRSMASLAKEVGVTREMLSRVVGGKTPPSAKLAVRLSVLTGGALTPVEIRWPDGQPEWERDYYTLSQGV